MRNDRRSSRAPLGALVLLLGALVITVAPSGALAAGVPAGAAFPPPGGVTLTLTPAEGTPPNDGFIGKTGGSTANFSSFGGVFTHMWWGPDLSGGHVPGFAFDGAVNCAPECLNFHSMSGNQAIWGIGSSTLKYISGGAYTTRSISTRFRMVATTAANAAINWVTPGSVNLSASVGAVIPVPISGGVPQNFKVMRIFEACSPSFTSPSVGACNATDANWEPVNNLYNRMNTDPAIRTISSIRTGFYWNRAPVAVNQGFTINEDTPSVLALSATDADAHVLTYSVLSGHSNGTLTGNPPTSYSPATNYFGTDSFTYKVNDGFADSATATVTITINPVNDAPVATPLSVSLDEDTTLAIELTGTDVDNLPEDLTFEVVDGPANGTLSGDPPLVTYAPNADFNGSDSFTYRAFDGSIFGAPVTVSIEIVPVNDAPVAFDLLASTPEDTPVDITLDSFDVDGDALSFIVVDAPSKGTLSGAGPTMTFTPTLNENGIDTFTYKVNDGALDSNVATVTIEIPAVNDAPVADDQQITIDEDTPVAVTLTGSDVDNDLEDLTFTVVSGPSNGVLTGSGASLTYTPNLDFNGTDSFMFQINDGSAPGENPESNVATVSITINAVNDAPVADDLAVTTAEDNSVGVTLSGSDVDNAAGDLVFSIVDGPASGSIAVSGTDVVYTPDLNFFGTDTFTYVINDGALDSNIATVTITVDAVNDAPVADDQSLETDEDIVLPITLTAADVDNPFEDLTFTVLTGPTNGTLGGSGEALIYTPFQDFNGDDEFTFVVDDGDLESNIATVDVTVISVNDNPVAVDDVANTPQYTPVTFDVLGNDSDVDGDTPYVASATDGATGTTTVNEDGTLTYDPTPLFKGSDSLTYTIEDGAGGSATGTVSIIEIGCGEDGLQALDGTPADGAASEIVDLQVEPIIGSIDEDTAANIHAFNCANVVPVEDALDAGIGDVVDELPELPERPELPRIVCVENPTNGEVTCILE